MSLDIGGWLKRLITLPKSKNSLSDLLGQDLAVSLKETGKSLLEGAVANVLKQATGAADVAVETLRQALKREAKGALQKVSPLLAGEVDKAIDGALVGLSGTLTQEKAAALQSAIVQALFGRLGL